MTKPARFSPFIATFTLAGALALAGLPRSTADEADVAPADGDLARIQELELIAEVMLGLRDARVAALDVPQRGDQPIRLRVPLEGHVFELDLAPAALRAANYKVLAQIDTGELIEAATAAPATLRGAVVGMPGSRAGLTILPDGLYGAIAMPAGGMYWIEPIGARIPGAAPDEHVVYHGDDVIGQAGTCAVEALPLAAKQGVQPHAHDAHHAGGNIYDGGEQDDDDDDGGVAGGGGGFLLCAAQLACDADFEFFSAYGSVAAVEAQINAIVNAVNVQYENEVGITHQITQIIVRTAEPDPYTATGGSALLAEFRDHWNANHSGVTRDAAHLFTGRNLDGPTVGIAYVGTVCSAAGYALSQSDCCGSFGCATDLTAHELGHNWGAGHCDCNGPTAADDYTMNASLLCANQFHPGYTIPDIVAERDSLSCLSCASTVVTAPLGAFTVIKGEYLGGVLAQLLQSDNGYVRIRAVANNSGSSKITDTHAHAVSPHLSVSRLDVRIETRGDGPGIKARVYLRNWDNNSWVMLQQYNLPQQDTAKNYLNIPNPNRYVHDGSGEVRVRLYTYRPVSVSSINYRFRIDRVKVKVAP